MNAEKVLDFVTAVAAIGICGRGKVFTVADIL